MAKHSSKKKRVIWLVVLSVLLALLVLSLVYLNTGYRADKKSIDDFSKDYNVTETKLDGAIAYGNADSEYGVIFYPGGKVDHYAYSPLMRALAKKGVLCVLVEMPFDLAFFAPNAADGKQSAFPGVSRWYMAGHSLGGVFAASYLKAHLSEYDGLILLASYSTSNLSSSGKKVLSVYGSKDGVMNRNNYASNKSNLPAGFVEMTIDGGCHAGFAMYGRQNGDGTPEISSAEQIVATADIIYDFLTANA